MDQIPNLGRFDLTVLNKLVGAGVHGHDGIKETRLRIGVELDQYLGASHRVAGSGEGILETRIRHRTILGFGDVLSHDETVEQSLAQRHQAESTRQTSSSSGWAYEA